MKKFGLLILCFVLANVLLTACSSAPNSPIRYERKLGKYFENETQNTVGTTIDLSEGPKLRYDAKLGPRDLNFDFKIVNPY